MPRTYIDQSSGTTKFISADSKYGKAEAAVLGNTDFDAIYNPTTAFNFVLEVEALYFLPLRSVKAFTKENEFEYIREGGVNDYVHMKRKPISKPFTFQVEKYVGTERFLDPLALGTELVLPLILYVYRHQARQGLDSSASAPAYPARMYIFTGCTVISKEYGELNAEQSSILTETTTIAYRELIAVTNPFQGSSEKEEWTFKDNKEADGTYKNKYAAVSPSDNKEAAYPFSKNKDGQWERDDAELYDFETGAEKVKRAAESKIDIAGGVYKYEPGKIGKRSMTRIDDTDPLLNKPAWDGSNGAEVKWAKTNEAKDPQPQMYPDVQRARENTGPSTAPVTYPPTERAKSNKGPTPAPVTWPPTRRALMAENLKR